MANKKTEPKDMNVKGQYHYANGKRKCAIARVRLYEQGTGEITINGMDIKDFCNTQEEIEKILSPLTLTGNKGKFTITIKIIGGGPMSQAEAIRHGITKALTVMDVTLRTTLKKVGYLRRDARVKERKKFGLKKARRAPQFSKR